MKWTLFCAPHHEVMNQFPGQFPACCSQLLEAGWEGVEAVVPGNFELDLMRAGKLPDLYFSENTLLAQTLEDMHVWYCTTAAVTDPDQYLHFEGIDTFADIYVNGVLAASADNMYLPQDVSADWKMGENEVLVHIWPTMIRAREYTSPVGCYALKYGYPSLYVRKAAHMYGWDIMPRIVSAGLWKPVTLCEPKQDVIREVYFVTNRVDVKARSAQMRFYLHADIRGSFAKDYRVKIEGHCKDSSFVKEEQLWHNTHAFAFEVENCYFWWPKNAGQPDLYDTTVTLYYKGEICDTYQLKAGIRTMELERSEKTDAAGSGNFCFRVNGKDIFVLGTNWVPLDAFHSQDPVRLKQALALLDDIGCNMVRCWGGNVYESDAFYEFCDARGILVWQDFAMGCAVYPHDSEFTERLSKEAVYQIKRLRNHPALALWAGDNENDQALYDWNGFVRNPNHNLLTRQILPELVRMHDYARPFLPSSPYISEEVFGGDGLMPENHLWGPRDYFKGDFYKNTFCHFASETGYHGFPAVSSLKRFLREPEVIFKDDGTPTKEYLVHATCMETEPGAPYSFRIRLACDQVVTLFGKAEDKLEEFVKQSQISQAEAKKYFIEKFRIGKWKRTGIIWWNLVDGWPQVSDAIVDYYFTKKLAYHFIKRSQEPVCLMFDEPVDNRITLVGVNDLAADKKISYRVYKIIPGQEAECVMTGQNCLAADTAGEIGTLSIEEGEKTFYLIEWEMDGQSFRNHYFTNIIDIDYLKYLEALKQCGMDQFEA